MLKTIYIAGVPASGKTRVMKRVIERLEISVEFDSGTAKGLMSPDTAFLTLGVFDGSLFQGTDRLSMAVINDALALVKRLQSSDTKHVLIVEGDRLFNEKFIKSSKASVIVIDATENELRRRHALRGDKQTQQRLKACRTKIENFLSRHHCNRVMNDNEQTSERIVSFIVDMAKSYI